MFNSFPSGFSLTFPNRWKVEVGFGVSHLCENFKKNLSVEGKHTKSRDAEIKVYDPDGVLIRDSYPTDKAREELPPTVYKLIQQLKDEKGLCFNYLNPGQVAAWIACVSTLPGPILDDVAVILKDGKNYSMLDKNYNLIAHITLGSFKVLTRKNTALKTVTPALLEELKQGKFSRVFNT